MTITVKNPKDLRGCKSAAPIEKQDTKKSQLRGLRRGNLNGQKDHTYIDLGLALLCTQEWGLEFGECRTLQEIADYCGCTREAIRRIEHRALRKLRAALYRDKKLSKELQMIFKR